MCEHPIALGPVTHDGESPVGGLLRVAQKGPYCVRARHLFPSKGKESSENIRDKLSGFSGSATRIYDYFVRQVLARQKTFNLWHEKITVRKYRATQTLSNESQIMELTGLSFGSLESTSSKRANIVEDGTGPIEHTPPARMIRILHPDPLCLILGGNTPTTISFTRSPSVSSIHASKSNDSSVS